MRFFQLYQTYFLFLLIVISTNSYSNQTTMGELLQKTFEFITKNKTPEETKDQQDLITTKFSRGENLTPGDFCYLFFDSNPKNFENIDLINNIMNQLLLVQKVEDVSDLPDYLQILEPQRSKKDPALESSLLEYFVSLIEEDSDSFIALLSYYAGRYGEYPISEECRKKALKTTLLQVLPKKEDINPSYSRMMNVDDRWY
ncbi:hypothetical protein [Endozoicomonas sp. Mp262]|uniref:hypothetical protein n=1 Tax=Endozoicomonas sp. Mp262 TaxID=2919499 RepID=UPI0021D8BDA0